jgi:hypothetical protein
MVGPGVFAEVALGVSGAGSVGVAAREFAAAGVAVFPCAPGGKRPVTGRGFGDATTDVSRVEAWWARIPTANIGVPTGAVSGMVVVDVDVHGPVDGRLAFARAARAGLVSGWGVLVGTPTGGMHAFFRADPHVEQRSWQVAAAGVDFRGEGGYVIVPPSVRVIDAVPVRDRVIATGGRCAGVVDGARLRDFLDPRPGPAGRPGTGVSPMVDAPVVDVSRLASWVAARGQGERNRSLFWAACRLAESDVPVCDALDVLTVAGRHAGLSDREIATTVRSAFRIARPARRAAPRPEVSGGRGRAAERRFDRTQVRPVGGLGDRITGLP